MTLSKVSFVMGIKSPIQLKTKEELEEKKYKQQVQIIFEDLGKLQEKITLSK